MNFLDESSVVETFFSEFSGLNRPNIRPVEDLDEMKEVYRLTHTSYVSSGYSDCHPSNMLIHYPYFDHIPESTILIALMHGKIVGSVSLTIDGPNGLTVDEDFKEDCDKIRAEGKPLATVWRLVVDESHRNQRTIVMNLINEIVHRLLKNKISNCLFAVNPKHANVYQRMLNMQVVATRTTTNGLCNAPAVLLRGDPEKIPYHGVHGQTDENFNALHFLLTTGDYIGL
uniref:Long chain N-acyltyrosine synthase n=1 Tax=uncultured bacterium CSLF42 TaxID=1091574 RepID=Q6XQK9_9BACT|nr:long chain N-acyltyrosine synthase [uncultured bacterium CSLF42]